MLVHVVTESTHKIARKLWDNSGHFLVQFLESTRAIWLAECIILLLILDVCSNGLFLLFCFFFHAVTHSIGFVHLVQKSDHVKVNFMILSWVNLCREGSCSTVCLQVCEVFALSRKIQLLQTAANCGHLLQYFSSHDHLFWITWMKWPKKPFEQMSGISSTLYMWRFEWTKCFITCKRN